MHVQGVFFTPPKSTENLIWARLGVSRTTYVNVDSPNLGFPYFNFLGEAQCKKHPVVQFASKYIQSINPIFMVPWDVK